MGRMTRRAKIQTGIPTNPKMEKRKPGKLRPNHPRPIPRPLAPARGQTQSGTPDPDPEPKPEPEPEPEPAAPTKAELEAQVESYLDANQFAEAAEVYRQMNTLGYVSREKLGSSLVEVGDDAEYYWSETDYGNNSSPYVKTAFDLYTEAAGLGCAQAYAKLAYCYDYGHYVSQDPAQACHWWTQMANTGDGPACYFVAEYYAEGNGVPPGHPYRHQLAEQVPGVRGQLCGERRPRPAGRTAGKLKSGYPPPL